MIEPEWPVSSRVHAFTTTRQGGFSEPPYESWNLALHVGDDSIKVKKNRSILEGELISVQEIGWLNQVHGTQVVELTETGIQSPEADGVFTSLRHKACAVMTADCLPVFLVNKQETWVAAIHAGWRGLVDGILEQAVQAYGSDSEDLIAWLGPAISARHFEIGDDVRQLFLSQSEKDGKFFKPFKEKYLADLYGIARRKLEARNLQVYGGDYCTYNQSELFYSYRRDGVTGRMASVIWIE